MKCPKCKSTNLAVQQRNCNFSAFNGYHQTWSRYSLVRCRDCGWPWRTKAKGVDALPDVQKVG
jgi:predicted Zn-ribbon and HTH transcriptional regulator